MADLKSYLSVGNCKEICWLNCSELLYVKTDPTGKNIIRKNIETGAEEVLFTTQEQIGRLFARGETVIFTSDVGGNENEQIFLLEGKTTKALTDSPKVRHYAGGFKGCENTFFFSANARDPLCFDLMCLNIDTLEEKTLLENRDNYNTPCSVSPDGRYLLYNKMLGANNNALWMFDTKTGAATRRPDTDAVMAGKSPAWLPDSSGFYYISDEDSDFFYLAFCDLKTGKGEKVRDFGRDVEGLSISPDGRYLAVVINEDGYSVLRVCDRSAHSFVSLPTPPAGVYSTPVWSKEGHSMALTVMSGPLTKDVWVIDVDAYSVKRISDCFTPELSSSDFSEPIKGSFKSFDGLTVPYFLYVPKGKEPKDLPVMISIHGGPEGQSRPGINGKEVQQYYVSQGIAIVEPNVRGSLGYGKTYCHLDDVEKRLDSVKDIKALVDHLIEEGIADKDRIGVMGGSYGGFMTLNCAARYPELWCCCVATVGMFNLVTFLENTSPYRRRHREQEYGSLEKHRDILYNVSPVAKVDDIVGPLLIIHGKNDPRVPVTETYQAMEYLQKKGVDVSMMIYDDEGHGLTKFKNRLDCYPRVLEFVKKHMGI